MITKEVRSLLATSTAHGVMHSYLVVLPALLPLVKQEIGDYVLLGVLISIVYIIYGWGALPAGIAADKFSKKILIVSSMILCGLSSILVSLSKGLPTLAFSLAMLGVGTSLYHPAGFSLVSLISRKLRGRYMGVHGVGGNAGMAFAYIASGALSLYLGWRATFLVWGFVGLATAFIVLILLTDPEKNEDDEKVVSSKDKRSLTSKSMAALGLLFLIIICSGALWDGVSAFLVTYINEVKMTELFLAGGFATISYLVGSLSQMFGGELSDRLGRGIVLFLGFGSYSLMLLLFTLQYVNPTLIAITVSLLGFTFFVTQAPLNALLGDVSPAGMRGKVYGINFAVKYGIGGVAPAIAGYLAVTFGLNSIFYLFAAISAVGFVASVIFFLQRRGQLRQT